jgi:hypothetical protein
MRFFFPDSQDQVDPAFDFVTESTSPFRVRQRDDRYAHEVLQRPSYDGLLLSKAIVDGLPGVSGKYTAAQRHRLYRIGIRRFFRLDKPGWSIMTMGDCGAFTYARDDEPPYSVDEVIDFYEGCGFDMGISVDHVILGYDPGETSDQLTEWNRRQRLTLDLASAFLQGVLDQGCRFQPIGVAQGWSPRAFARAVDELQRMGYKYIALGGMVPLKTAQILACLEAIAEVRLPDTRLHLLGVTRCDQMTSFAAYGVESFDSTSPFRQAFKDDHDNYYTADRNFLALRVPQVEGNPKLKAAIRAGRIDNDRARLLEQRCLQMLNEYDAGRVDVEAVLESLAAYSVLFEDSRDRRADYRDLLENAPWKSCPCGICASVGIHVVIFRGTERNKRRGFHNLHVFTGKLQEALGVGPRVATLV